MLDQLPTAIAVFDEDQRLVFHNAAYRALWKLDEAYLDQKPRDGEILDRLRTERRLPEEADYRKFKAGVLAAYQSVEPPNLAPWYLPDGRTLQVIATANPRGGVTYVYDDVTERRRLETSVESSERVQRETLDALEEGVAVFGTDGRLKLWNVAFARMWKLSPDLLRQSPHVEDIVRLCRTVAPEDAFWRDVQASVSRIQDGRTGFARRLARADGSVFEAAGTPLADGATMLSFRDVTAAASVERMLTEHNEALEKIGRLRDEFMDHMSFELRSPLTHIIGFAQMLGNGTVGPLNAQQKEYTSHIVRSSAALLAIINDILDLQTIDEGVMELDLAPVDVRAIIGEAAEGVQDRLVDEDIRLEIDLPEEIGGFVADGKRLRQILFNLLSNAIGFSPKGATVTVRAVRAGSQVVFQVVDRGRGIPEEVRDRVFRRFESFSAGSRHRGVGLGLSIVRSFVELHGGEVELDSGPGRGTTVTCRFPADAQPTRNAAE